MRVFILCYFLSLLIFCSSNSESLISETKEQKNKVLKQDSSIHNTYSWKSNSTISNKLINRIEAPKGFIRKDVEKNSFGDWLRNLPLKEGNPDVLLYNGAKKANQIAQYAVVDIDIGNRDLQQCADAVMRLKAEYLFSTNQKDKIAFNFTSGDKSKYSKWKNGIRPIISGNSVTFKKTKTEDFTYNNFRKYLLNIFTYCGTYSLEKELKQIRDINTIEIGDVFINGGFPGHAVLVVDLAVNTTTNEIVFLLAQSYMPAQNIHILKNPLDKDINPWFSIKFGELLLTPEWEFEKTSLKRF